MKVALLVVATALAVQIAGETASAAYNLQPISRVFAPSGSKATQSFELVNDGADRIALTVSFLTLERDESYAETNHDADDEFLAYPAQLILPPGARQTVRVTWLGTPKPLRELAYRIIVTQIPISVLDRSDKSEAEGQMRIMLTYRGTLFIRPPNAAPKIAIHSASLATVAGGRALAITLENAGTAVGLVKACAIQLDSAGTKISVAPAALVALRNTRVLGGGKRRYTVPWPNDLTPGAVKATGQCSVEP